MFNSLLEQAKTGALEMSKKALEASKKAATMAVNYLEENEGEAPGEHATGERVPFKKNETCKVCNVRFEMITKPRHHCRRCGESFCSTHVSQEEFIPAYGYSKPVRVCDECVSIIHRSQILQRIAYRATRVHGFLNDSLEPIVHHDYDSNWQKAQRGALFALKAVKVLPLGDISTAASAADFLSKYGLYGFAGFVLKEQLVEAVDTLKLLCGNIPSMSLTDVTGGLYYLMSMNRGERGDNPTAQSDAHTHSADVSADLLDRLLFYGPHALHYVYQPHATDVQRLVSHRGYSLLFSQTDALPEQPAYYVCASKARKEVILAIRGTQSIHDCMTDVRALPSLMHPDVQGHVHSGIGKSALWLYNEVSGSLKTLVSKGFNLVIVGHSLGAGCATLLSILLKPDIPVQCYAYATPACVEEPLADLCRSFVTSIVLRDDVVPRATPRAAKVLAETLLEYRGVWRKYYQEDMHAFKQRAKGVWAPRTRTSKRVSTSSTTSMPSGGVAVTTTDVAMVEEVSETLAHSALCSTALSDPGDPDCDPNPFEDNPMIAMPQPVSSADANALVVPQVNLYIPGTIVHLYQQKGRYHAASVDCRFEPLNQVELQLNMIEDHKSAAYFMALREARGMKKGTVREPPAWGKFFAVNVCQCCHCDFTWASTSSSLAQQNFDRHHCRRCGQVVCNACSSNFQSIPEYGIFIPSRVCDSCFYDADLA
eukprot:TRINITY_DN808_c0_g1::TRINITY_DN808_c0_g1_i2::g.25436::m.25436 TRINITY_DN808_c0_g1::TRINITY_DN808_c0_g1_i2::g.25436  ORF type:complete len:709 (+),score=125.82,sp/Q5YLM1/DGLA_RAT/34.78/3e-15,FYVE/PF01363.16/3.9e-13,FYVE/PF01363.16/9.2e-12,Lipase_3/PF01764.20/1.6e-20,Abhydrolase_6/PF12697.2/0.16,PAS_7/PF12860.2/0.3,FYVE_2/PF02318.11/0.12,FYVE_2/PF02318.11/34 TRINITY_DN808_c0_g1_i2:60-2186(+)